MARQNEPTFYVQGILSHSSWQRGSEPLLQNRRMKHCRIATESELPFAGQPVRVNSFVFLFIASRSSARKFALENLPCGFDAVHRAARPTPGGAESLSLYSFRLSRMVAHIPLGLVAACAVEHLDDHRAQAFVSPLQNSCTRTRRSRGAYLRCDGLFNPHETEAKESASRSHAAPAPQGRPLEDLTSPNLCSAQSPSDPPPRSLCRRMMRSAVRRQSWRSRRTVAAYWRRGFELSASHRHQAEMEGRYSDATLSLASQPRCRC